jgi:hypothetical protein
MPGKTRCGGKIMNSVLGTLQGDGAWTIKQLYVSFRIVSRVTIDIKVEKEAEASSRG